MSFGFEPGFPDDEWIPMPLPEEDVPTWAAQMCDAWEVPSELRATYLEQLAWHAERFRELDVARGAVWLPDVEAGFVATWSLDFGSWEDQQVVEIDEVVDVVHRRPRDRAMAEPVVEVVDLPVGPAVRVREYAASPDEGDATLTETVTHVVVPKDVRDDQGRQVVLTQVVTWTEVAHGDELAAMADEIAELLVVRADG